MKNIRNRAVIPVADVRSLGKQTPPLIMKSMNSIEYEKLRLYFHHKSINGSFSVFLGMTNLSKDCHGTKTKQILKDKGELKEILTETLKVITQARWRHTLYVYEDGQCMKLLTTYSNNMQIVAGWLFPENSARNITNFNGG